MPENSGKKDALTNFLRRVARGTKLVEEIWIDREVQQRGSKSECSQGDSLSGNPVHTITNLLQDDLSYCFSDNNFIFRVIAAEPGSGKTAVLEYLDELTQFGVEGIQKKIVPIFWSLNSLTTTPSNSGFGIDFYLSLITELFDRSFTSQDPVLSQTANGFLLEFFDQQDFNAIVNQKKSSKLQKGKLRKALLDTHEDILEIFLEVVNYFHRENIGLLFLIDELDSLYESKKSKDAMNTFRNLINQVDTLYERKIPLSFYISGLSDDVVSFIEKEEALKTRIYPGEIRLVRFRIIECEKVRKKIEERLFGAYNGYQDFSKFRQAIKDIKLEPGKDFNSLREFCMKYGYHALKIHHSYFPHHEKGFNIFEKKSRRSLEHCCLKEWEKFMGASPRPITKSLDHKGHKQWWRFEGKQGYELRVAQTNTIIQDHSFDCYAELCHRDHTIAKAYGEAKNYDLVEEHLETFQDWLHDVDFKPRREIPDLAYFFTTGCPNRLRMKVENSDIQIIYSSKEENNEVKPDPIKVKLNPVKGIDINHAPLEELRTAFKGSGMRQTTIGKLIKLREKKKFKSLDELITDLNSTTKVKKWLQNKLESSQIYFGNPS